MTPRSTSNEMSKSAPILEDSLFNLCISLAKMSRSSSERYGSIVVSDGSILGMGYNRAIAHPSFHL
jgi:deoxycytidylate deaminase